MKQCCLIIVLVSLMLSTRAQSIFRQNATQRKYSLQQIISLQAHILQLKKGYDIAKKGYNTIQSVKNGEFSLHNVFISDLKIVNPKIKRYARVADIVSNQVSILKVCNHNIKRARSSHRFRPSEIAAITEISTTLLNEVAKTIDQLAAIVLNGKYEMTDDERIIRIDRLYTLSTQQRDASLKISQQLNFIDRNRLQQFSESDAMRKLYDIP